MPKQQHIGSHQQHARPDEKMSRRFTPVWPFKATSTQRAVMKKNANAKRRRRDNAAHT